MVVKISEKAIAGRERKAQRALEKEAEAEARVAAEEDAFWQIGAPSKSAREKREEKSVAKARAREERREIERRSEEIVPAIHPSSNRVKGLEIFSDPRSARSMVDIVCYSKLFDIEAFIVANMNTCIEEAVASINEICREGVFRLVYGRLPYEVKFIYTLQRPKQFNDCYVDFENEHLRNMPRKGSENTRSMKRRLYKAYLASDANPLFVADTEATIRQLCDELQKNGTRSYGYARLNKQFELRLLDYCRVVRRAAKF